MIARLFIPFGVCMLLLALLVSFIGTHSAQAEAQATTYLVDRSDDPDPAGLACTNAANDCSLRAAVIAANANPGSSLLLTLPAYTLTIPQAGVDDATTGDLNIITNTQITRFCLVPPCGNAIVTAAAGWTDRLFHIHSQANATMISLTLRGGNANYGGGISIDANGVLTLTGGVMMSNTSNSGGALHNQGRVLIQQSQIVSNTEHGIYNNGTLTVIGSLIGGNRAYYGGGIQNSGVATLVNSTIAGNSAGSGGGGIDNNGGYLTMRDSVVMNNFGGLVGGAITTDNPITLTNTTLSSNSVTVNGGGLFLDGVGPMPVYTVTLINVTIAGNAADSEGDGSGGGGGLYSGNAKYPIFMANTIVAGNIDNSAAHENPDCIATIVSQGYNLIGDTTGCILTGTLTGNLVDVDPLLGSLQDNGGSTWTHALLPGSPAIDGGHAAGCPHDDQRGVGRPINGTGLAMAYCDIGAYEYDGLTIRRVYVPSILH